MTGSTDTPGAARVGLALWGTEPLAVTGEHARLAEQVGFESVWLVDSQLLCRELYVTLAACAAATRRVKLATGVTVPRTRHASVTASALAALVELAPGRIMAGFGTGHSALRNVGQRPARIAELAGYVKTVRTLLEGGTAGFESGAEGALAWLDGPVRVPLHVAATGPRLTRAAPAMADGVILLQGAAAELVDSGLAAVARGAREAQREPRDVPVTVWVYVGIDGDPERARDQVRGRVAAVLRMASPASFDGEDREVVERVHRDYDLMAHGAAAPAHGALVPGRFLDRYAIAGQPEHVAGRIRALLADPRIHRVVVSPQVGAPGSSITRDFIARFGEAVLA